MVLSKPLGRHPVKPTASSESSHAPRPFRPSDRCPFASGAGSPRIGMSLGPASESTIERSLDATLSNQPDRDRMYRSTTAGRRTWRAARLSRRVAERSSQAASSRRCWMSSQASAGGARGRRALVTHSESANESARMRAVVRRDREQGRGEGLLRRKRQHLRLGPSCGWGFGIVVTSRDRSDQHP